MPVYLRVPWIVLCCLRIFEGLVRGCKFLIVSFTSICMRSQSSLQAPLLLEVDLARAIELERRTSLSTINVDRKHICIESCPNEEDKPSRRFEEIPESGSDSVTRTLCSIQISKLFTFVLNYHHHK